MWSHLVFLVSIASYCYAFSGDNLQRMPGDFVSYASAEAFELRLLDDEALGVSSANLMRLTYRLHQETDDGPTGAGTSNNEIYATLVALQLFYEPPTEAPRIPILFITDRHPVWEALMTAGF